MNHEKMERGLKWYTEKDGTRISRMQATRII